MRRTHGAVLSAPGPGEGISRQVVLPFRKALEISLRNIRVRFARSMITVASLVLAVAFFSCIMTGVDVAAGLWRCGDPSLRTALVDAGYDPPAAPPAGAAAPLTASPKERWIIVLSLLVCTVGIVNAQLIQVDWETQTVSTVYENVQRLIEAPSGPNPWIIGFALAGAAVMLGLVIAYQRFYWWPIHPIGYLTMYSSSMRILWFSFFLGWLANHLTIRYGGVVLFRRVRLLFAGLILGDFLMGGVFAVIGLWMGQSYLVLPN